VRPSQGLTNSRHRDDVGNHVVDHINAQDFIGLFVRYQHLSTVYVEVVRLEQTRQYDAVLVGTHSNDMFQALICHIQILRPPPDPGGSSQL
jgi:hypothetical protein